MRNMKPYVDGTSETGKRKTLSNAASVHGDGRTEAGQASKRTAGGAASEVGVR